MSEPCGWEVGGQCGCAGGGDCWTSRSPTTRARAAAIAGHILWAATGRRYGLCEVTVLPCNPAPPDRLYQEYGLAYGPEMALTFGPGTVSSGGCGGACTCGSRCEVTLPGPIDEVDEVLIDGEPVSPDAYRVYDLTVLARLDGLCWPTCNTYGEIPGFQVTYQRGTPLPSAVQHAYDALACTLAKSCDGEACELPANVRSLTRQGITIDMAAAEAATVGKLRETGIKWVDDLIQADNPYGLTEPPEVLSLDLPPSRQITWAGGS